MKVLVAGPVFHHYNQLVGRAFESLGADVRIYSAFDGATTLGERLSWQVACTLKYRSVSAFERQRLLTETCRPRLTKFNERLMGEIDEYQPDILFIIRGDFLFREMLQAMKERRKDMVSIIWMQDSALRFFHVLESASLYDLFYTYEPADLPELHRRGIDARLLPQGFDPDFYRKLPERKETLDLVFVGRISNYPNRHHLLSQLVPLVKDMGLQVAIYGRQWPHHDLPRLYRYKIKEPELGSWIRNFNISHSQAGEVYNSAKICLNLPDFDATQALTPRTLEITGAGGFQLTDYKESLEDIFEIDKEIVCYRDINELKEKIGYYLEHENERKEIAEAGYLKVHKAHTFRHRIEKVLKDVGIIKGKNER